MIVIPLPNGLGLGKRIAKEAGAGPGNAKADGTGGNAKLGNVKAEYFPDGEIRLQFLCEVAGKEVVLVQPMHPNPNDSLLELVFAGLTAKDLGAKKVIGVVPYLAYMRQDRRFHAGECVSNKIMAHLLNQCLDKIITVDPHLHRVHNLEELFHIERRKLSANHSIAEHIQKKFSAKDTVIAGPDIESSQWAKTIAERIGFESAIFLKERFGPRKVKINVTRELEWKGKNVIIVDDIISSGHTMIEAVKEIRKREPKAIHVICVHAIFAEGAYEKILKAGAKSIVSCNTIAHKSNGIDLAGLIAKGLL